MTDPSVSSASRVVDGPSAGSAECVGRDAGPPRVLVIDDGITMRLFYRTVLEAAGFMVEEAANGVEGYEKVLASDFDLLIVDINMPKMDGYSMMRAIRRDAAVRGIPAVTISTEASDDDARKAFESGANYYLVKPVEPDTLTEVARLMTGEKAP